MSSYSTQHMPLGTSPMDLDGNHHVHTTSPITRRNNFLVVVVVVLVVGCIDTLFRLVQFSHQ